MEQKKYQPKILIFAKPIWVYLIIFLENSVKEMRHFWKLLLFAWVGNIRFQAFLVGITLIELSVRYKGEPILDDPFVCIVSEMGSISKGNQIFKSPNVNGLYEFGEFKIMLEKCKIMPEKCPLMPEKCQLCLKNANYAWKRPIMPEKSQLFLLVEKIMPKKTLWIKCIKFNPQKYKYSQFSTPSCLIII